jgi:hypothetical protein
MLPWGNLLYLGQYGTDAGPWEEPLVTDLIREVEPDTGEIVWEWRLEDAISPEDYYCPICIETLQGVGYRDWSHSNTLHFYEQDSTILLNVRNLNTVLLISYPSGDVLWALGDAGAFGNGLFHHSHDPEFLPNGNLLLFDNDYHGEAAVTSRALEITFDPVAGTAEVVWEWREEGFYVPIQGDANHLPNDNVLVTDSGKGRVIEVNPFGEKVWEMIQVHPVPSRFHHFYKSERIALPGSE